MLGGAIGNSPTYPGGHEEGARWAQLRGSGGPRDRGRVGGKGQEGGGGSLGREGSGNSDFGASAVRTCIHYITCLIGIMA